MPLPPGTRLGHYEVLAPLGAGGMGEVYRARDTHLGRDVAVKVLPLETHGDPDRLARFAREARAASSLNHPSIVHVYDVGAEGAVHYIAMELVDGRSVRALLQDGPLPVRKLLDLAIELTDGISKAHAAGIVHRDLKPENLLVTPEGHVKILDFGLAKQAAGEPLEEAATGELGTQPGVIMGTLGYMSPEQASGRALDFRSDQFSLGAVLYEMAAGRRAFPGASASEVMAAILRDAPEPLARVAPRLPPLLRAIVEERCLAKDPQERYASTWDLLRDLRAVRDHLGEDPPPPSAPPPVRHWATPAAAATLLALAAGAVFIAGAGITRRPRPAPGFRQLTFERGLVRAARFAPDGQTVVYSAAWEGRPCETFVTRADGTASRALGLPGSDLLSISSRGDLAVSLGVRYLGGWTMAGTLARLALVGGAPRALVEGVHWADWSPDGAQLALVRESAGRSTLEFPAGRVLYSTAGWISHPRVAADGQRIAFLDHPVKDDDAGTVALVDGSGARRTLTGEWRSVQGLAWSPARDLWFSATTTGGNRGLHAVTLEGRERLVLQIPGALNLHDVSPDGRVLFARDSVRQALSAAAPGSPGVRELAVRDWSNAADLSADGRLLLIAEQGDGGGAHASVYLRRLDAGEPPVLLGEGQAMALSPDGRFALAVAPGGRRQLRLLPTGAGETRSLPETGLEFRRAATFLRGGRRALFEASEPGHLARLYVGDLEGGPPRPVAPEGVTVRNLHPVSRDGAWVAATAGSGAPALYPIEGGAPRPIPGSEAGDIPIAFSEDDRHVYVFRRGELPAPLLRIELAGGRREAWRELAPADPAGIVSISRVMVAADGQTVVFNATRTLSELYLAEGLE